MLVAAGQPHRTGPFPQLRLKPIILGKRDKIDGASGCGALRQRHLFPAGRRIGAGRAIGVGKRRRVAIIAALTGRPPVRADESGAKHAIVPLSTGAVDNATAVVGPEQSWSITPAFKPRNT